MIKRFAIIAFPFFYFVLFCLLPHKTYAIDNFTTWQNQTSLPYQLANQDAVVYNNKIYVIGGGSTSSFHAEVQAADIDSNGNLGPWQFRSNLPNILMWHSTLLNGNRMYVIGGVIESSPPGHPNSVDTVFSNTIDSNGNLGSWQTFTPLPQKLSEGYAAIYNNKIYYVGGAIRVNGSYQRSSSVYSTSINPDGSIGTWASESSLPEARDQFTLFQINNKIIVIGGETNSSAADAKVMSTTIDGSGHISSWQTLGDMISPIRRPLSVTDGDSLYLFGGYNGSSFLNTIYSNKLDSNGQPTTWIQSSNTLPYIDCCSVGVINNNIVYLLGGSNGSGYLSSVISSPLNSTVSSTLFDLPFQYPNRPNATQTEFKSQFWTRLTAGFDHEIKGGTYRPFTGDTYKPNDCPNSALGIQCYDGHNGTDFTAYKDQPTKNEVFSVADGDVVFTSDHTGDGCTPNKGGFGCVVIVNYPTQNVLGLYAHLKKISVDADNQVTVTTKLGDMGNTGCGKCGQHLHFGVMQEAATATSSSKTKMTKSDWKELLAQIAPNADETLNKAKCNYIAPNGVRYTFQDPTSWYPTGEVDPWSLAPNKDKADGCSVQSPYLWKFDVGTTS